MKCPFCKKPQNTKVIDSRITKFGAVVRRRRECLKCKQRFSTREEIEIARLKVIKRDGSKQEYNRKKIEYGLRNALQKRPVSEEKLQKLLNAIERSIQALEKREVKSKVIGRIVMDHLRSVDDVAFIRFASVYKSIGSANTFNKVVQDLLDK